MQPSPLQSRSSSSTSSSNTTPNNKKILENLSNITSDFIRRTSASISETKVASPTAVSSTLTAISTYFSSPDSSSNVATAATSNQRSEISDHETERNALYVAFKASLNSLVDFYAGSSEPVEDGNEILEKFCTILEHVLWHGAKSHRGWKRIDGAWEFVSSQLDSNPALYTSTSATSLAFGTFENIRNMEGLKTPMGRLRAWIRLSLMDASLARSWQVLLQDTQKILPDYYEPWALLRNDQLVAPISGLLLSLESIEFNFCLRGEDLENKVSKIDWAFLMDNRPVSALSPRTRSSSVESNTNVSEVSSRLQSAALQKSYLEDLNRSLQTKNEKLAFELEEKKRELKSSLDLMETSKHEISVMKKSVTEYEKKLEEVLRDKEKCMDILKATQGHLVTTLKSKEELKKEISVRDEKISALETQVEALKQELLDNIKDKPE